MTLLAYSVKQAVDAAPISRSALYLAMRSGELRFKKRGRRTFILADDLRQFLETQADGNS
jgi:hypothetical protein